MRTWLFYKLGYWQDSAPTGWLMDAISWVRYELLWVHDDHKDDYL